MKLNEKGWPKNRVVREKVTLSAAAKKLLKGATNKAGVAKSGKGGAFGQMSDNEREKLYKAFAAKLKKSK